MKYITGVQALNLPCSLNTSGDWHRTAIKWEQLTSRESCESVFGEYGIETCSCVPFHPGAHHVANHLRACLDLIEAGNFSLAQGMRDDFLCDNTLDQDLFEHVLLLKDSERWEDIVRFMGMEYDTSWLKFLAEKALPVPLLPSHKQYSQRRETQKQESLSALTAAWSVHKRIDDLERLMNFTLGHFDELTGSERDVVVCSLAYVKLPYIQYAFEVEAVPPEKRSEIFSGLLGLCRKLGLRMDTGSDRLDGTGLSEFDHEDAAE